jgi:hypothetical protein
MNEKTGASAFRLSNWPDSKRAYIQERISTTPLHKSISYLITCFNMCATYITQWYIHRRMPLGKDWGQIPSDTRISQKRLLQYISARMRVFKCLDSLLRQHTLPQHHWNHTPLHHCRWINTSRWAPRKRATAPSDSVSTSRSIQCRRLWFRLHLCAPFAAFSVARLFSFTNASCYVWLWGTRLTGASWEVSPCLVQASLETC